MQQFITDAITNYGYLAIFLLMLAESACIPIPSEITMLFGGAVAAGAIVGVEHHLNFIVVGLAGVLGNVVGSWLAYWVGSIGGRPMIDRFGRFVLLRPRDIDRAELWFAKRGERAVFVARLLPVIRTFISLPAGVAEMPFGRFTLYTLAGCFPWVFALAGIGYALGTQWTKVEKYLKPISMAVAIVAIAVIAWWYVKRLRERRAERLDSGR